MSECIADSFRAKLSEKLKHALTTKNKEEINTLRSVASALDNASAISSEEISKFSYSSITEVPRRNLNKQNIKETLQAEIKIREIALKDFKRIGNHIEIESILKSIEIIKQLNELLEDL